ncbi:ferrochelatase [Croceimicrobium hydrocarbonivorans]|uniref:Ferrochelatase n=1 Tax=Croceimicrobium hydrocarbonivorans TaxID=2761580 RepID=A0A7H0VGR7_9FLAO|nr:ferrochelatase [Croceimicrobium hydrocarbonivorans]QNR24915.1 ferrochelatase [Croceimicrobium hydrocarbonivorans]
MKQALLIVNLGSPDSYAVADVRRYLGEFLMDERVVDFSKWFRTFLVKGIILNTRPPKSAEAYKGIWWEEGSPLMVLSERLKEQVQAHSDMPVGLGMRYGNPSIHSAIQKLKEAHPDLETLHLIPLYPHYAMSSYETVVVKAREVVEAHFPDLELLVKGPFYDDERYLNILANSIKAALPEDYDYLLFSYHGVPERQIRHSDVSKAHCLRLDNCCAKDSPAQAFCYRHQTLATTEMVARQLDLKAGTYSTSFQSRLGPIKWLDPYTDKTIAELAQKGVKKLAVVCPAFVSDCLETIEEIGVEAREIFMENGGEDFTLIPCLNDQSDWAKLLADFGTELYAKKIETTA